MHTKSSIAAVPSATDVIIVGEPIVGGTLAGSYRYVNDAANPEGTSRYSWSVDGLVVASTREFRVLPAHAGANIVFAVTPVAQGGEIGATEVSAAKRADAGFQNIGDEENANSFMKQQGNFSFFTPEPSDRIFVSTGGAFALIDPPSQDIFVKGQNEYGAAVPDSIKFYLKNNPAAVLFATEWDFGALVPFASSNQLLVWGRNMTAHEPAKLRNIRAVYANGTAFAYIYNSPLENRWIGAIGPAANGGNIPDTINLKLLNDPPRAIYATFEAFAVLTHSGRVYAWGSAAAGGSIDAGAQAQLDRMRTRRIVSNMSAFCALDDEGGIAAWGNQTNGGNIPADRLGSIVMDGGAKSVVAVRAAFCAITRGNARAVSWGHPQQGGTMTASAKALADAGNIVLCRAANWAFCIVNAAGGGAAWGVANSGGTMPPIREDGEPAADTPEPLDMSGLMAMAGVAPALRALFLGKMRKCGVDVGDEAAVKRASARLAASMDSVCDVIDLVDGRVSVYGNDTSFFLLAQDEDGRTTEALVWGRPDAGGSMPAATKQVLMSSRIKATYCTNGAYGVIADGAREGFVTVWGVDLAHLDAGEIPRVPPEIAQKLAGGVIELYSIKRQPPLNPTPVHTDPSFAARHRDGSYVLWGGNVDNQVFVPENDETLRAASAQPAQRARAARRYSYD